MGMNQTANRVTVLTVYLLAHFRIILNHSVLENFDIQFQKIFFDDELVYKFKA